MDVGARCVGRVAASQTLQLLRVRFRSSMDRVPAHRLVIGSADGALAVQGIEYDRVMAGRPERGFTHGSVLAVLGLAPPPVPPVTIGSVSNSPREMSIRMVSFLGWVLWLSRRVGLRVGTGPAHLHRLGSTAVDYGPPLRLFTGLVAEPRTACGLIGGAVGSPLPPAGVAPGCIPALCNSVCRLFKAACSAPSARVRQHRAPQLRLEVIGLQPVHQQVRAVSDHVRDEVLSGPAASRGIYERLRAGSRGIRRPLLSSTAGAS